MMVVFILVRMVCKGDIYIYILICIHGTDRRARALGSEAMMRKNIL